MTDPSPSTLLRLQEDLARELTSTSWVARPLVILETIDSTNSEALRRARSGTLGHGGVIVALEQRAGRGRLQRSWVSPREKGVYLTALVKPDGLPPGQTAFGLAMALAARRGLAAQGIDLAIKWPNDLLLEGRKVGGILAEGVVNKGRLEAVAIGLGLNLTHEREDLPPRLLFPAGAINQLTGRTLTLVDLIPDVLRAFEGIYDDWTAAAAEGAPPPWLADAETHLWGRGRRVRLVAGTGDEHRGRLLSLSPTGGLRLDVEGREETFLEGDLLADT